MRSLLSVHSVVIWDYKILEGSANDEVQMNFLNIKALKTRAILFYVSPNKELCFPKVDYFLMHIQIGETG